MGQQWLHMCTQLNYTMTNGTTYGLQGHKPRQQEHKSTSSALFWIGVVIYLSVVMYTRVFTMAKWWLSIPNSRENFTIGALSTTNTAERLALLLFWHAIAKACGGNPRKKKASLADGEWKMENKLKLQK